jgi:hypothetical protein
MRKNPCYYCGESTVNPSDWIENSKRWVCDNPKCQDNFNEDDDKAEKAAKVVCAWCNRVLKEGTEPISHGICPECAASLKSETEEMR